MRSNLVWSCIVGAACAAACGSVSSSSDAGSGGDGGGGGDSGAPGFTIAVSEARSYLRVDTTALVTVTVTRTAGFTGEVAVTTSGLPAGVAADPLAIGGDSGVLALTANSVGAAPGGPTLVTVTGTSSALTSDASLELVIVGFPGDFDMSFGTGGTQTYPVSADASDSPHTVIAQAGGKVVVAGREGSSDTASGYLLRINPDGTLDTTFGDNGTVRENWSTVGVTAASVAAAVQSDGKIVVLGGSGGDVLLARFTVDGDLDAEFALRRHAFGSADTSPSRLAIGPGDVIVVGGWMVPTTAVNVNDTANWFVARFLADGDVDATFAGDGLTEYHLADRDFGGRVTVAPDGSVYGLNYAVASCSSCFLGSTSIFKLTPGGVLDTSFDTDGYARPPSAADDDSNIRDFQDLVAQPDGKLLVSGFCRSLLLGGDPAIWRLAPNGTPDATFATNGLWTTADDGVLNNNVEAPLLASDGSIYMLVTTTTDYQATGVSLVHLSGTGAPDTTYGSEGITASEPWSSYAFDSAITTDRRIVAGWASSSDTALAMFWY
jgi:uncharacterized delta-60 repeat protein